MAKYPRQSGFSLMELLVALAIVLILIGALIGAGSYVRTRANVDLTRGMLETLSTALEQYYSVTGNFPFVTYKDYDGDTVIDVPYDVPHMEHDLNGFLTPTSGLLPVHAMVNPTPPPDTISISSASSAALFYFLDRNPASRAIVEAVPNTLVTNKDSSGVPIKIDISGIEYDLPRYIDPWKTSIRYVYLPATAFPVLTSAGPDKFFDTPDDITSK